MKIDWNRWHELLDLEATGDLSHGEMVELGRIHKVVDVLDIEEARLVSQKIAEGRAILDRCGDMALGGKDGR